MILTLMYNVARRTNMNSGFCNECYSHKKEENLQDYHIPTTAFIIIRLHKVENSLLTRICAISFTFLI